MSKIIDKRFPRIVTTNSQNNSDLSSGDQAMIVHFTMTSQTTATADVSVGEIYNAFSAGRSVMCNVDFLGANTYIKLSVAQYDPADNTYSAEWITVGNMGSSGGLQYVGLAPFQASDGVNWNLYLFDLAGHQGA